MQHVDRFSGYTVNIYKDCDGDWLAHFVELPGVSACGDTPEEALSELKVAWDAMKASYKKHGESIPVAPSQKEYSGQFNVRIDRRVHRNLAVEAATVGISLNALVAEKLALSTFFNESERRTGK